MLQTWQAIFVARAQGRGNGPANSLHASAYYSEYNERFDLICCAATGAVKKTPVLHLQLLENESTSVDHQSFAALYHKTK